MTTNHTKRPCNIQNGRKIFLMVIKYYNIFHSEALQILPKIGSFGWKTNHLATPLKSHFRSVFRRNFYSKKSKEMGHFQGKMLNNHTREIFAENIKRSAHNNT
jgi:hypothetical protein